jgi:hypothetical protein
MPPPWLAIIDAAIGLTNMALARRRSTPADETEHVPPAEMTPGAPRAFETHLTGVMVSALREVFSRDTKRLDLERDIAETQRALAEAERERAERALRLELRRQAGDREIGRLRLMAGLALIVWLATLILSPRFLAGGSTPRLLLGSSWFFLTGALACVLVAMSRVSRALADPDHDRAPVPEAGAAGALAAWFILTGFVLAGAAALVG